MIARAAATVLLAAAFAAATGCPASSADDEPGTLAAEGETTPKPARAARPHPVAKPTPRPAKTGPAKTRPTAGLEGGGMTGQPVPITCPGPNRSWLVPLASAPFPYDGPVGDTGVAFLDVRTGPDDPNPGHTSPRGGVYRQAGTYSDSRVLLSVPPRLDPARATIVLYLHGNEATLADTVCRRQAVPRQVAEGLPNAVLIAPQLAVNALDSSAGKLWEANGAARLIAQAMDVLAGLGHPGLEHAPIVVVAYSGGYLPAVYSLEVGGIAERTRALILLDALFGEAERYGRVVKANADHMAFVSAYSASSAGPNGELRRRLRQLGVPVADGVPERLVPEEAHFIPATGATHNDFVTRAFAPNPLAVLLKRARDELAER